MRSPRAATSRLWPASRSASRSTARSSSRASGSCTSSCSEHREALLASIRCGSWGVNRSASCFGPPGSTRASCTDLRAAGTFVTAWTGASSSSSSAGVQVPPRGPGRPARREAARWPVFAAERRAMEENDIPYFTARAEQRRLIVSSGQEIPGCFLEPSFDSWSADTRAMDDDDLERQVAFIEGALYAHAARETTGARAGTTEDEEAGSVRRAVERGVRRLGARPRRDDPVARDPHRGWERVLDRSAAAGPGGPLPAAAVELRPLQRDLLVWPCSSPPPTGSHPEGGFGDLALGRHPAAAERPGPPTGSRRQASGIGGAAGVGSVVYSLVRLGRLLDAPALLGDARRAADLISDDVSPPTGPSTSSAVRRARPWGCWRCTRRTGPRGARAGARPAAST